MVNVLVSLAPTALCFAFIFNPDNIRSVLGTIVGLEYVAEWTVSWYVYLAYSS